VSGHPWKLVAPWYRWPRYPGAPATTPPVLQKYETTQLVDLFLKNPQHSLKFTGEDAVKGRRKLYLTLHKRFYLVVCELHCDRLGFPNARRDDVCEAGFVLRRRRTPLPAELEQEATQLLRRIGKRKAQLGMLEAKLCVPCSGGAVKHAVASRQAVRLAQSHTRAQARLAELQDELNAFAGAHELAPVLEGWFGAEGLEHVGAWRRIEDDGLAEQVYPLYPLTPDPALRPHAARGRSLYFGLVPTGGGDCEADGTARFDEKTPYELHCFVRRHDPHCPRKPGTRDCHGELTWSAPSEPFTLASPNDLVGTANRPVTIALPDIPALLDQAAKLPFGQGAPLKLRAPEGSSLPVVVDGDGKASAGAPGLGQICSFAIPLITIVAFFVLRLFLPIVVLLFGLWPLLRLRFCIPPALDLGLDLQAELAAVKGGADLEARADADVLRGTIRGQLNLHMPGSGYGGVNPGDELVAQYSLNELVPWVMEQQTAPEDPVLPAGALASPNAVLAPLIWEDELPIPELPEMPSLRETA
jgi:hypothetical protein